mmetsp:Transcript_1173/g.4140  ORF Transcript_1173/g.4140 Transcript_1173/m.4140 type:complete len:435 (-) Transcript_1173:96-1400(-)
MAEYSEDFYSGQQAGPGSQQIPSALNFEINSREGSPCMATQRRCSHYVASPLGTRAQHFYDYSRALNPEAGHVPESAAENSHVHLVPPFEDERSQQLHESVGLAPPKVLLSEGSAAATEDESSKQSPSRSPKSPSDFFLVKMATANAYQAAHRSYCDGSSGLLSPTRTTRKVGLRNHFMYIVPFLVMLNIFLVMGVVDHTMKKTFTMIDKQVPLTGSLRNGASQAVLETEFGPVLTSLGDNAGHTEQEAPVLQPGRRGYDSSVPDLNPTSDNDIRPARFQGFTPQTTQPNDMSLRQPVNPNRQKKRAVQRPSGVQLVQGEVQPRVQKPVQQDKPVRREGEFRAQVTSYDDEAAERPYKFEAMPGGQYKMTSMQDSNVNCRGGCCDKLASQWTAENNRIYTCGFVANFQGLCAWKTFDSIPIAKLCPASCDACDE